jgi:NAD(P)-binding Rossmann-like domain
MAERVKNRVANDSVNGVGTSHSKYVVEEQPLGEPRHLRIAIIGAGAAGLNIARHLDLHMQNIEHTIYEKNADVGGTWFENRFGQCKARLATHKLTIVDIQVVLVISPRIIINSHGNLIQSGINCCFSSDFIFLALD